MSLEPVLISVSTNGENANANSFYLSSGEQGRFVVFASEATNLVEGAGSGVSNYLRDVLLGTTQLIEIGPDGEIAQGADFRSLAKQIPGEPTKIAFTTDGFGDGFNLYLRDMDDDFSVLLANDISRVDYPLRYAPFERQHIAHVSVSQDGRTVAYTSDEDNPLVGDTNGLPDIFLQDIETGEITLVSVGTDDIQFNAGSYQPRISPDGTKIVFYSRASNIVDGDTNNAIDVFVKDLVTGSIELVSEGFDGSPASGDSVVRNFSSDGRYIIFDSLADNLVENDNPIGNRLDVFVKDLVSGEVIRVSQEASGTGGSANSYNGGWIPDSEIAFFVSFANNLLENDQNRVRDVMYTELGSGEFVTLNFAGPLQPNNDILTIGASPDANFAFVTTEATNLVPQDTSSNVSVVRVPLAQVLTFFQEQGDDGPNDIVGDGRINFLFGLGGDDTLQGSASDDLLDGGAGTDVARFSGNQSSYTVSISAEGVAVQDRQDGRDGTDSLTEVETLVFQDADWDLSIFADAALLAPEDFRTFAEMYIAYFDRAPDAEGLAFWASALQNDVPLEQIAALFFDQNETRALYPDLSDVEVFAGQVYQNVLGREFDQEGLDFWVGVLQSGAVSLESFVLEIIRGAKAPADPGASAEFVAQKEADVAYLKNKADLGIYFSVTLGMNDFQDARAALDVFDGSQASINQALGLIDGFYADAIDAEAGEFLLPIVGVLENPFPF